MLVFRCHRILIFNRKYYIKTLKINTYEHCSQNTVHSECSEESNILILFKDRFFTSFRMTIFQKTLLYNYDFLEANVKNYFLSLFLFTIISILTFYSCSDEPTKNNEKQALIPLKAGYSWVFAQSLVIGSSVKLDTITAFIESHRAVTFQNNSYQVFVWKEKDKFQQINAFTLITSESDGYYNYGGGSDTNSVTNRQLWLKYPTNTNDNWLFNYYYYSYPDNKFHCDTCSVTCMSISDTVTVPAGSFNCYQFRYDMPHNYRTIEYWSPGVGLVKYMHFIDGTQVMTRELLSYFIYQFF